MSLTKNIQAELRKLPSVDELINQGRSQAIMINPGLLEKSWVRDAIDSARQDILKGVPYAGDEILLAKLATQEERFESLRIKRVINATGIILHTNLGRAPLPRAIFERLDDLTAGYCNLEMNLNDGERGARPKLV